MNHSINFSWTFIPHFNEQFNGKVYSGETVDLPHSVKVLPFNYFNIDEYQMISLYQKYIDFDFKDSEDIIVNFEGVSVSCKVYLNDVLVGENYGSYSTFSINLTPYYRKNQPNLLSVVVDSNEQKDVPPFGHVVDYLLYGGIYREVSIDILPKINFKYLMVEGNMYGQLRCRYELNNTNNDEYHITYKIKYQGKEILEFFEDTALIPKPNLWSIDEPNLYELEATLTSCYGAEVKTVSFGFRTAEFKKDGFYLNCQHIKLLGLNRHQSYPYVGYAMPKSMQEEDARILKEELGVNYVRCSHYPMSKHFLSACDKLGLVLLEEIPGWQHVSNDTIWRKRHLDNVENMIKVNFNHPSIVIWGVRINEGRDDHELYTQANKIAKKLDPNRATGGVRNFKKSELLEDVYTYNDFYHYGPNKGLDKPESVCKKAPYLVTENNGHMYPTKPFDNEDRMIEHTLRHARVIDAMFSNDRYCGESGWCMNDYNTHKEFGSGDMICYHGVNDMFRNKKYAASIFASQQDKFFVMETLTHFDQGEKNAAMLGKNYVITNADYIEFYKNDNFINKFYPDKKSFPNMPHAPIVIDDYIGNAIVNDNLFKEKDALKLTKVLNYGIIHGMSKLKLRHYFTVGLIMLKYKLSFDRLYGTLAGYVTNWGCASTAYEIKAYKDDQLMQTQKISPSVSFKLVSNNDLELNHDLTYDVKTIHIKAIDQDGNILRYCMEPLTIKATGDIEIIGPSIINLSGGQTGVYVKSIQKGEGKVEISSRFNKLIINIKVK